MAMNMPFGLSQWCKQSLGAPNAKEDIAQYQLASTFHPP